MPRRPELVVCALLTLVLSACSGGGAPPSATTPGDPTSTAAGPTSTGGLAPWPGYHADQARTGAVGGPSPGAVRRAWTANLGGAVRGQPLVLADRVVAATETDRVVALDPASGRVLWSVSLGRPLTGVADAVGCGNIDPLGVTGTPVYDPATGTVYAVAEVADGDRAIHHQLVGLDAATGGQRFSAAVDPPLPPGESPLQLLQRPGLALANGRVYVAYGGHLGDCGHYHGWVVGASTVNPSDQVAFQVAPDGEGGAIWQSGGAPAVDADGNVYVSTGNSTPFPGDTDPGQWAESVVKLSPSLQPLASFKDRAAGGDEDLSTGNPVLLPDGTVFAVGKTDVGYLLDGGDLHQVAAIPGVCGSDPDGGPAYDRATGRVFVPCRGGGIQVVDVAGRTLGPRLPGADSAPVVVGSTVWALDSGGGGLTAFDAASGDRRQSVDVGADVPVFASPSFGLGTLFVGTADGVTAFR
jgi:outer membrane protein assembly factor BamB